MSFFFRITTLYYVQETVCEKWITVVNQLRYYMTLCIQRDILYLKFNFIHSKLSKLNYSRFIYLFYFFDKIKFDNV